MASKLNEDWWIALAIGGFTGVCLGVALTLIALW